uniref:Lipocalin/cytosolic fatty-acid binding domain-containing protein n=1 Tax=Neobodo designis TaxID=312471 RepID=A0A7S1Q8B3_NEODS|eukprot:CAMPEP_0174854058 /NCGR_PEP_ID=MMETSP1114-20130205/29842_1 /TAXON_ID=312471 /ORGANISM="Neobodo designis, Strain CCAP 1951/1" /LENGTH=199 /DNA_ID=CAMNT_0016088731 /DNA_START=26 /DNA_END=625 /DNA_ORIENTATION=+
MAATNPFDDCAAMRKAMEGDWHIAFTTLKMYRDGKKLRPWCRYTQTPSEYVMADRTCAEEVSDASKHPPIMKLSSMEGTTTQKPEAPSKFLWRGSGWLKWITMDFRVVYMNESEGVAATCFEKTFHSEAGCEIIVRDPAARGTGEADDAAMREAAKAIRAQPDFGIMGPLEPAAGTRWDPVERPRGPLTNHGLGGSGHL